MKRPPTDRKLSPRRKGLFACLTIILVYGLLEGVSLIAFAIFSESPLSLSALQTRRTLLIGTEGEPIVLDAPERRRPRFTEIQSIHPFVGYVLDPTSKQADFWKTNEYGFPGALLPLDRKEEHKDTVFVAVLGGSVAGALLLEAEGTLRQELQKVEAFAGKKIFISSFTMGGMKQPQQLMIVNYFMSLGARFDLVINLDGFNDMVLATVDKTGTNPFYPRGWKIRLGGFSDRDELRQAGRIAYYESVRTDVARFFSRTPVRYSMTANFFWDQLDLGLSNHIARKRSELTQALLDRAESVKGTTYAETGPRRRYASEEAQYVDLAAYWKRSSIILANLARSSGFRYFHFLQPNQYVPDSKIFSEEERAVALPKRHRYRKPATEGYPYLIEAGKELAKAGVIFTDLTMMFADNDEILYVDGCCHFNRRGYELIAKRMARVIRENLGGR